MRVLFVRPLWGGVSVTGIANIVRQRGGGLTLPLLYNLARIIVNIQRPIPCNFT